MSTFGAWPINYTSIPPRYAFQSAITANCGRSRWRAAPRQTRICRPLAWILSIQHIICCERQPLKACRGCVLAENVNGKRIRVELRRVYVGGGRAALSRATAYRNEAKVRVRKRYPCECEKQTYDYPGHGCEFHGEWFAKRVDRLARFMRFLDRKDRERRSVQKRIGDV